MIRQQTYWHPSHIFFLFLFFTSTNTFAQNADIDLLRNINLHSSTAVKGTMIAVTNSAYPLSLAFPVAGLIVGYARHDQPAIVNSWQATAGLAINTVLTYGLKYAVNRPRPYVIYPYLHPYQYDSDPSFPSGHTSFAFTTAASLTICYPAWYISVPAYLWAGTVGYSRMYLGMHYPSDVLAGAVIGSGSAWLACKGNRWLQTKRHKKQQATR